MMMMTFAPGEALQVLGEFITIAVAGRGLWLLDAAQIACTAVQAAGPVIVEAIRGGGGGRRLLQALPQNGCRVGRGNHRPASDGLDHALALSITSTSLNHLGELLFQMDKKSFKRKVQTFAFP